MSGSTPDADLTLPPSQRVVPVLEHVARAVGRPLRDDDDVLDFGAGAGRHVAEFRAAGYAALGVDSQFRSHAQGRVDPRYLRLIEPPDYVLPFDADTFDFVYSMVVMEHVLDPGSALSEIARVLRPSGLSIHCFPSRWRPIEPHTHVPFGGRFNAFSVLRLWAALGIRNEHQQGLTANEVALSNAQFARTGVSYPSAHEWRLRARHVFAEVSWAEAAYVEATRRVSTVSRVAAPVIGRLPAAAAIYRGLHTRVLVLRG